MIKCSKMLAKCRHPIKFNILSAHRNFLLLVLEDLGNVSLWMYCNEFANVYLINYECMRFNKICGIFIFPLKTFSALRYLQNLQSSKWFIYLVQNFFFRFSHLLWLTTDPTKQHFFFSLLSHHSFFFVHFSLTNLYLYWIFKILYYFPRKKSRKNLPRIK